MAGIFPTVGRIVWYRPYSAINGEIQLDYIQPFVAQIVYVWSESVVNLAITDHGGITRVQERVTLYDGDWENCPIGQCCWMPYQKAKAKEDGNS